MRRRQAGMSMIVALFLVVVVALLAAFAIGTANSQREQTNLQLLADRAAQAAHAGTEWAATRALVNNSCVASSTLNLTQGALNGYTVTVACIASPHTEPPATNYTIYDVTAFAQYGRYGAEGYASKRTLVTRFTNAP